MDSLGRPPVPPRDAPDASAGEVGGRAKGRDSLFLMAQMTLDPAKPPIEVRVRNLSAGGLMIEYDRPVLDGATVTLSLRGIGEVGGRIAWCAEGRIGVAFDRPIDPMLARKPVGKGPGTPAYAKPQLDGRRR